jgi:hypothetical protein
MIKSKQFTYVNFLEKLKNNEIFSFSRYGDGEWNAIFGAGGQNCDGHQYFSEMGKRLKEIVISSPKYIMGLQNMAKRLSGPQIEKLLIDNNVDIEWTNSDILHRANINGRLGELFEVLSSKRVHFVAPSHLKGVNTLFEYKEFLDIPEKNCWTKYNGILKRLRTMLAKKAKKGDIVLFCASMMTNVLIDDVYEEFGEKVFLLDVGSIFEPHIGMSIRRYHNDILKKEK